MLAEFPISRQSSMARINAFMSAGSESVLATISMGSRSRAGDRGFAGAPGPPTLTMTPVVEKKWAAVSGVERGTSAKIGCRSGVSRDGSLFQKNVASPLLFRKGSGVLYSHTHGAMM